MRNKHKKSYGGEMNGTIYAMQFLTKPLYYQYVTGRQSGRMPIK